MDKTALDGLVGSAHCKHASVLARPRKSNFRFDILFLKAFSRKTLVIVNTSFYF
jgi:hypothetical protein